MSSLICRGNSDQSKFIKASLLSKQSELKPVKINKDCLSPVVNDLMLIGFIERLGSFYS